MDHLNNPKNGKQNKLLSQARKLRKEKKYQQAEKKLEQLIKQNPQDPALLLEKVRLLRLTYRFEKAEELLQKLLQEDSSVNFYKKELLQESAKVAFQLNKLEESANRYHQLRQLLEEELKAALSSQPTNSAPGPRGYQGIEKKWLQVNKKINEILWEMRDTEKIKNHRRHVFDMLGGVQELKRILRWENSSQCFQIHTEMFTCGLSNYFSCLHQLTTTHQRKEEYKTEITPELSYFPPYLVEKCLTPQSREPFYYQVISEHGLFQNTHLARTPQLVAMKEDVNYKRVLLEYVNGKQALLERIDPYLLGFALGEIAKEFAPALPEKKAHFRARPLKEFDPEEALYAFSHEDPQAVKKAVALLESFHSCRDRWEKLKDGLPLLFCHNDISETNIVIKDNWDHPYYYFLDWERASYNAAGSDLGDVIRWGDFRYLEEKGKVERVEKLLINGYLDAISELPVSCTAEEVRFAAYYHFINQKTRLAIQTRNFELFRRIAQRSKFLQEKYS